MVHTSYDIMCSQQRKMGHLMSLSSKMSFLCEIDRLKSVYRASSIIDRSRKENSAEHSWHIAMYALVLSDQADAEIDLLRVLKMLLIHDIVEIDAGDAPLHGEIDHCAQAQKERHAAERLFGMLEQPLKAELLNLWCEFEEAETGDARFAKSLDRLQPLVQNTQTGGGTWIDAKLSESQVCDRYGPQIERGSEKLWSTAQRLVRDHFSNH